MNGQGVQEFASTWSDGDGVVYFPKRSVAGNCSGSKGNCWRLLVAISEQPIPSNGAEQHIRCGIVQNGDVGLEAYAT